MSFWFAFGIVMVIAIGTYLLRAAPALLLAGRPFPLPVQRALRNVGPSVLAALVVVTVAAGTEGVRIEVVEIIAIVVAGLVAWWRRNQIWSLAAGMIALWIALAIL